MILRSYDSRREPSPEFDCKIWQAGRATCAIGLAFKPIQIGQSIFHDDGVGTFNPAPEALDEAVVNEWPGRDVGVFVSVGTGKRPGGSDANHQMWYEGFLGEFAEARRRLISKIEGCETIHEYMLREHLAKRNVNAENYYRLNVEIGVGEFGMNEWHRLGDISTGTRQYMAREAEQKMIQGISVKLAKIYKAKARWDRMTQGNNDIPDVPQLIKTTTSNFEYPLAVELPGDSPTLPPTILSPRPRTPPSRSSYESGPESINVSSNYPSSPRTSYENVRPTTGHQRTSPPPRPPRPLSLVGPSSPMMDEPDRLYGNAPTPLQYRHASGADKIAIVSSDEQPRPYHMHQMAPPPLNIEPPPLPPKTPLPELGHRHHKMNVSQISTPPYPLDDEEPPTVNMSRKPEYRG